MIIKLPVRTGLYDYPHKIGIQYWEYSNNRIIKKLLGQDFLLKDTLFYNIIQTSTDISSSPIPTFQISERNAFPDPGLSVLVIGMKMWFTQQKRRFMGQTSSLLNFILKEKSNRKLLVTAGIATLLQFTVFKFLYPYPDFFSDSYSYIYAASANLDINIWPIGYSKFLYIFHELTHSSLALVAFQYFFLEISCLFLFFTILYLYISL